MIVARGRVAKSATFGVKWASDESFCPSTVVRAGWWRCLIIYKQTYGSGDVGWLDVPAA